MLKRKKEIIVKHSDTVAQHVKEIAIKQIT